LRNGLLAARGTPETVLGAYETDIVRSGVASNAARVADRAAIATRDGSAKVGILEVHFRAAETSENGIWLTGKPAEIVLSMRCPCPVNEISVNVMITDLTHQVGETVQFMTSHRDIGWLRLDSGHSELRLGFPAVGLRPGTYRVKISVSQGLMHDLLDVIDEASVIVRDAGLSGNCLYFQPRDWTITGGVIEDVTALQTVSE
jgi:hypothetical protein